jgi:toxin FitB
MFILDTNVISDQMNKRPDVRVQLWMNAYEPPLMFLTSINIAELCFGAWLVKEAARREGLLQSIDRIRVGYQSRLFDFDERAGKIYGKLCAERQHTGRPIETKDAMIAAICLVHGATLATRNVRDFDGLGLKLVNPFEA